MKRTGDTQHAIDRLAHSLPPFQPDDARAEQVRTATLARVTELAEGAPRPRRRAAALWIALPVAAAAGIAWFLLARHDELAEKRHGAVVEPAIAAPADAAPFPIEEVRPRDGARFERTADSVALSEGSIEVEVRGRNVEKPLRVATRDVVLAAANARFEVEARGDRLVALIVQEGRVEMQSSAERTIRVLVAGETWTAPPASDAAAAPPTERHRSPRKPDKIISTEPAPPLQAPPAAAPGEPEFRAGWAALRSGKARDAADAFSRARKAAGDSGLGEDAHFWQGIALARAGERARAISVLRAFTSEHPRSARAGEATARLGWLYYDAGRLDEATRSFEIAAADRVPEVMKSAKDGLEAIARRRRAGQGEPR